VGRPTVETMVASGATALVIDADRTLILDLADMIELADANDLAIVSVLPLE
jgi:DUF1009 family protein